MKFGIRECAEVVFRAKTKQKIGKKIFFKDEPVVYFDTLKTSTLEGAATTVYAQGGRGNTRLLGWDGDKTLTFTMEDALISQEGIAILTGAGLIYASEAEKVYVHTTATFALADLTGLTIASQTGVVSGNLSLEDIPAADQGIYIMFKDENGNIVTEPFSSKTVNGGAGKVTVDEDDNKKLVIAASTPIAELTGDLTDYTVFVDYYIEKQSGAYQINITPDDFAGYFYIEGETLFRDEATGEDLPAQFVIPNGKVQSNFTFTMASSGDPSTFTFTVDAFPGYVKGNTTKKVLASIIVVEQDWDDESEDKRPLTDASGIIVDGPASVEKGGTAQYNLFKEGSKVTAEWAVEDGEKTGTKITDAGLLTVDAAETADELTVKATVDSEDYTKAVTVPQT